MAQAAQHQSAIESIRPGGNILNVRLEGIANFVNWKFAIKMLLTLDGLWSCIETAEGENIDAARDARALACIGLSIQPNLYQYIRDAKTAKAWQKLKDT